MKIVVLEHPRLGSEKRFNDIANTPLWSCLMGGYAASALEQPEFELIFIDDALPGVTFEETTEKILALSPELLCVNAVYFWEHTDKLFDFITNLKQQGFTGHVNLFGFFPSLVYADILQSIEAVDSIAVGEFEYTLAELGKALVGKGVLQDIRGLATRIDGERVHLTVREPENDPDRFKFPKQTILDSTATILGSRGCYNRCSFCLIPSFDNQIGKWRGRSTLNIFKEIEILAAQGIKDFYFADPNFIGPGKAGRERTLQLLELLKPLNITFGMETRPNDLNDEIVEKLVEAGMTSLLMGIESGSSNILRHIKKSSTTTAGTEAIQLCLKYGIDPEIGFLMFVPDASIHDLRDNILFLKKNNLLNRLERTVNLLSHEQIVLAGTSGYTEYEQRGSLEKQGIFGFEGRVPYVDPKVEWVSKLVIFACSSIMRIMSNEQSPIFWKKGISPVSQTTNQYLVDLFDKLLIESEMAGFLNAAERQKEIERDILVLTRI
jgi:hypothetical protein